MQQLGKGPALGQKAPPAVESWDAGRLIMNLGAVSSLSGFMMSDVLYLRGLSVFGSLCGITYNATRQPAQWNGVAWGCVFISTNLYMIYNCCSSVPRSSFPSTSSASTRRTLRHTASHPASSTG